MQKYPNINWMIQEGTIEIGFEYKVGIIARASDGGGIVWEGEKYKNLEEALNALEKGIEEWYDENM